MLLGARSLIGLEDKDVYPIRGQTVVIDNPKVREFMMGEFTGGGGGCSIPGRIISLNWLHFRCRHSSRRQRHLHYPPPLAKR